MKRKYKGIFIFTALFLIAISLKTYFNVETLTLNYKASEEMILETKWQYTVSLFRATYNKAESEGQLLGEDLLEKIYERWTIEEMHDVLRSLEDDDNYIYTIFREVIGEYFFMGIDNDANDPFIVVLGKEPLIAADYSVNCASDGRTRTFLEEYPMHADIPLAEFAFTLIRLMADVNIDRTNPIMFQFPAHSDPDFKLTAWDLSGFKDYFMKSKGDWKKTFEAHEFIVPTYLFPDRDLSEQPMISDKGYSTDSRVLVVNNVFNFKDVLLQQSADRESLMLYDKELELIDEKYTQQIRYEYSTGVFLIIITIMLILQVIFDKKEKEVHTCPNTSSKSLEEKT